MKEFLEETQSLDSAVFVSYNPVTGAGTAWVVVNGRLVPIPIPRPEGWRLESFFAAAQIYQMANRLGNPGAALQIEQQIAPILKQQATKLMSTLPVMEPVAVG